MLNHQDRLFDLLDGMEMTKSEHDWLELRFANMTEKERLLFTGALELERPTQADRVMELANQLPCFDLYYGAGTTRPWAGSFWNTWSAPHRRLFPSSTRNR